MVEKLHIYEKRVFSSGFGFCNIGFIVPSYFIIVPYLTLHGCWIIFNTIRILMSNSLDPDQARHLVGPDLGQNCLQR